MRIQQRVGTRKTTAGIKHRGTTAHQVGGGLTGAALVSALLSDPVALRQLGATLAGYLASSPLAAAFIDGIEAVVKNAQASTPGRLLPGKVSTNAGALQLNGSSVPTVAMVFIGGAATAVACYIPTQIRATIAVGQDVWVIPINGNLSDMQVFSIRNVF